MNRNDEKEELKLSIITFNAFPILNIQYTDEHVPKHTIFITDKLNIWN